MSAHLLQNIIDLKLKNLLDNFLITSDEYEDQRKNILRLFGFNRVCSSPCISMVFVRHWMGMSIRKDRQMPGTEILNESEIIKKLQMEGYSNVSLQRASGRQQMGGAAGTGQQTQTGGVSGAAATGQQTQTGGVSGAAGTEMYTGTATKDGKQVRFQVDSSGRVTEE